MCRGAVEGGDVVMRLTAEQNEIIALLVAAGDGETAEEHCAQLERLVNNNEDLLIFLLQLLNQEAWLSLHGLHKSAAKNQGELAAKIRSLLTPAETGVISQALAEQFAEEEHFAQAPSTKAPRKTGVAASVGPTVIGWALPAMPIAVALLIGVIIGTRLDLKPWMWRFGELDSAEVSTADDSLTSGQGVYLASYQAKLMGDTACVWGQEFTPHASDSLKSGQSLTLIEGVAELQLSSPTRGKASVTLEGPSAMVLMADDGVNLSHGKLTANVELKSKSFAVETPLGRFEVNRDAKIGVAVSPSRVEIHVFEGEAKGAIPWISDSDSLNAIDVHAGQSIRLSAAEGGAVEVARGIAAPSFFVAERSMTDDLLTIADDYVAAVKKASPVCYWRFNRPVDGAIRNEMGDLYHGRVFGITEWINERDNSTVLCGAGLDPDTASSYVVADRPLKSLGLQNYSLEVWVKPSHFHTGSIASLVVPNSDMPGLHGMLLELGGPWTFTEREHPGRVRYLHRNPPDWTGGNSCFSNSAYGLRKWQHVVVVKDAEKMRLYIDGKLMTECENNSPLPDGLELLVGQLDETRRIRSFVGQLDELAFYERALSDQEIKQHYHLGRPATLGSK
jgi:hypothetical protein